MTEIIIGLVAGLLIGLTGVGVGTVMAALVVVLTPVSTLTAVGTSLAVGTATKLVGTWEHYKLDRVNWKLAGYLLGGSIPGTWLGGLLLNEWKGVLSVRQLDQYLNYTLALALATAGVLVLSLRLAKPKAAPEPAGKGYSPWQILIIGFLAGVSVSLVSIGSGSITILLLLLLVSLPASELIGTDMFYGLITVGSAAAMHLWMGNVDGGLALRLLVGSLPGVVLGSRLSGFLSEKGYGWVYAALYITIAARLVMR